MVIYKITFWAKRTFVRGKLWEFALRTVVCPHLRINIKLWYFAAVLNSSLSSNFIAASWVNGKNWCKGKLILFWKLALYSMSGIDFSLASSPGLIGSAAT
jgi:hypothetical protein